MTNKQCILPTTCGVYTLRDMQASGLSEKQSLRRILMNVMGIKI